MAVIRSLSRRFVRLLYIRRERMPVFEAATIKGPAKASTVKSPAKASTVRGR